MEKNAIVGNIGCFETYASMKNFKEKISKIKKLTNYTGQEILEIIKNEEADIKEIIDEYLEDLKTGLTNYINIFEPEAICIGGGFVYYKDILLPKLRNKMQKEDLTFNKNIPKLISTKTR